MPSSGPCAGAPRPSGATSGPGGARMYEVAEVDRARIPTSPWPARPSRRWRSPGSRRSGEFHYLHHGAGGARYDDPNAMGRAVDRSRAGGRDPDHPARHLLPARRDRAGGGGRPAALLGRQRRRLGRARRGARGITGSQARRGDPQRSRGRPGVSGPGGGIRRRAILAAPCPPLRAAGRERGLPGRLREDPDQRARGRRRPLGALHRRPRHAPGGERLRSARRRSVRDLSLPDDGAGPRRRRGAGAPSGRRPARGSAWAPIPTP